MKSTDNERLLLDFARSIAKEAGDTILSLFRTALEIESKPSHDWDPVTAADKKAEAVIRQAIETRFPDHGILGEEYGLKEGNSGFQWILDPIDGTRAFVMGMPTWATLIGLYYEGEPFLGVMHQPFTRETFFGTGQSAHYERNGTVNPIRVSSCQKLEHARAGTTSPHLYEVHGSQVGFDRLREKSKLMRYGGDAYFFCMLAAGHIDLALDPKLQAYDIAALIPIIRGAGGIVKEWTGGNPANGGNILAACTTQLTEEALEVLSITPTQSSR